MVEEADVEGVEAWLRGCGGEAEHVSVAQVIGEDTELIVELVLVVESGRLSS